MSKLKTNRGLEASVKSNTGRLTSVVVPFTNTISTLFDGVDDFAETSGDVPALNGLSKMTWIMWFKYTSLGVNKGFLAKWDFQTQGSWAIQTHSGESDEIQIFVANTIADGGGNHVRTDSANLSSGVWRHLAIVYDGTLSNANRIKFYINSVLESTLTTNTIVTTLTNGSSSVKVGKFGGVLPRNFNGNLDEVGIFKAVAFNQAEVNEAYNSGVVLNLEDHSQVANLNNYWRMGDGDVFPTIIDKRGNNNLTMVNMAANDFVTDVP